MVEGYIAGKLSFNNQIHTVEPVKPSVSKLTITYGIETGNAKKLASEFASRAKQKGINVKLLSLDQYRPDVDVQLNKLGRQRLVDSQRCDRLI